MYRRLVVVISLILITGCATVLPAADLRQGMPLENVKKLINVQPTREIKVSPPEGEEGNLIILEYNVKEEIQFALTSRLYSYTSFLYSFLRVLQHGL